MQIFLNRVNKANTVLPPLPNTCDIRRQVKTYVTNWDGGKQCGKSSSAKSQMAEVPSRMSDIALRPLSCKRPVYTSNNGNDHFSNFLTVQQFQQFEQFRRKKLRNFNNCNDCNNFTPFFIFSRIAKDGTRPGMAPNFGVRPSRAWQLDHGKRTANSQRSDRFTLLRPGTARTPARVPGCAPKDIKAARALKTSQSCLNFPGRENPGNRCCNWISFWYIPRSVCPAKGKRGK